MADESVVNLVTTFLPSSSTVHFQTLDPNLSLVVVFCLLSVTALVGNLFTIMCFFVDRKIRLRPSNFYIFGLAMTDLMVAVISVPGYMIICALGTWPWSREACQIFNYLRLVVELASPLMTVLISYDRYFLLSNSYDAYIRSRRRKRIIIELCVAWMCPMVGHFVSFLVWHIVVPREQKIAEYSPDCLDIPSEADVPFSVLYAVLTIFVPAVLLTSFNIGIFRKAFRRFLKNRVGVSSAGTGVGTGERGCCQNTHNAVTEVVVPTRVESYTGSSINVNCHQTRTNGEQSFVETAFSHGSHPAVFTSDKVPKESKSKSTRENRRYVRPLVMLTFLVAVFCVCWIPFTLYFLYIHLICPLCLDKTVHMWLLSLLYLNACINPIIYAVSNKSIRKCGLKVFNCTKHSIWR